MVKKIEPQRMVSYRYLQLMTFWLQLELLISEECGRDLVKLYSCQYCQPGSLALPCHSSCSVIVDQCFVGLTVFSQQWDVFISKFWLLMFLSNI